MNEQTLTSRWRRTWILLLTAALVASMAAFIAPANASGSDDEYEETYRVTVQNLTENQTLTPAVVATHEDDFRLFKRNRTASNGIQQLAENGGVPVLVAELMDDDDVADVGVTSGGPIGPGETASVLVRTGDDADRISVAAMLICTNDGFASVNSTKIPRSGESTRYGQAYDAGTEINTQEFVDLVPPCSGTGVGTGTSNPALAENGTVKRHRGITESGDLSPATHGWHGPAIKVTIERVATYEITITNLTTGQPITPAVFAAHNGRHDLFRKGAVASNGIQQLAENGGVPVLAAEAAANTNISASTVVGSAPLAPGASASTTLEVIGRANRFSLASMLVCTNDGFGGIDGKRLPREIGEAEHFSARAYDAGTEINTESFDDLVPPCDGDSGTGTGMSNPALAENGRIHRHAGIQGGADLTGAHAWSGPVVGVTIERIG
ncbi:MAG: spondin domain-containing protein [Actinomycetia bacterium]|nr:spondin domain-containing protein [Actinomycetes bacterium]